MTDIIPSLPLPTQQSEFELIWATIVDATTGRVRRVIQCPRHALKIQVMADEVAVEQVIARGKRWDTVNQIEVDDDPPPAPSDSSAQWDAAAWRWVTSAERNYPILRQIEELEKSGDRALRELALNRGSAVELRQRLTTIDDQIIALRAQLE